MNIKKILSWVWLIFAAGNISEARVRRGIRPLHSTRADVERLLGSSVKKCEISNCLYDLGNETVFIIYATGAPCSDDAASAWDVPRDTVIEIGVTTKGRNGRPLSDLNFDTSKYKKIMDRENPGPVYYINEEDGLRIEVGGGHTYYGLTYFQEKKENYLLCRRQIPKL